MLKDDEASRKTLGEVTLRLSSRAGADVEDEDAKLLLICQSHNRFPDSKKLHVDKTAFGSSVDGWSDQSHFMEMMGFAGLNPSDALWAKPPAQPF